MSVNNSIIHSSTVKAIFFSMTCPAPPAGAAGCSTTEVRSSDKNCSADSTMSNRREATIVDKHTKAHLEPWQEKELLIDIERLGGRGQTNQFLHVWNSNVRIYGPSGSEQRRRFQRTVDNIKRRKAKSYLRLLRKYNIPPCSATEAEAEAEEAGKSRCCLVLELLLCCCSAGHDSPCSAESSSDLSDMSDDEQSETLASTFVSTPTPRTKVHSSSTSSTKKNKKQSAAMSSGRKSRNAAASPAADSLGQSFSGMTIQTSESWSRPASLDDGGVEEATETPWEPRLEGTKRQPIPVWVNVSYPERHRESLTIQKMENQALGGKDEYRDVWHIETPCPCLADIDEYEASIPSRPYRTNDGARHVNQVLIRKPALSGWQRDCEDFNQKSGEACTTTMHQRDATITNIEKNPDRVYMYILVIFPEDADIDNSVLGHRDMLWRKVIPQEREYVREVKNDLGQVVTKTLHTDGQTILWKIAERDYSATKLKPNTTDKFDLYQK